VSSKQLAQLRSSLPSPKKYKGKQIAEKMGISSGMVHLYRSCDDIVILIVKIGSFELYALTP
jgi:hypothetical protein